MIWVIIRLTSEPLQSPSIEKTVGNPQSCKVLVANQKSAKLLELHSKAAVLRCLHASVISAVVVGDHTHYGTVGHVWLVARSLGYAVLAPDTAFDRCTTKSA